MTPPVKRVRLSNRERFATWCQAVGVRQVAQKLGVGASHVSRIQNGKKGVSGALAQKIQRLGGIPAGGWFKKV